MCQGQLGNGTNQNTAVASWVIDLAAVVQVAIGDQHGCFLIGDGMKAMCWGR